MSDSDRYPRRRLGRSLAARRGCGPMRGWRGSTGRSAPGCCCFPAGGASRWPRDAGPIPRLIALFGIGAVAMRGAGCTLNDIADRDYDAQVARTRLRPLPSGAVTYRRRSPSWPCSWRSARRSCSASTAPAIALGIARARADRHLSVHEARSPIGRSFSSASISTGARCMGWTAVTRRLAWPPVLLYLGGIVWTLGYDTIYAHQDKEDDARIGVKSSALALGAQTRPCLFVFYARRWRCCGSAGASGRPSARCFWVGLALAACSWSGRRRASIPTTRPIASPNSARTAGRLAAARRDHRRPPVVTCSDGPGDFRAPQHRDRGAAAGAGNPAASRDRGHADLAGDRGELWRAAPCRRLSGPSPGPAARRSRATCSTTPRRSPARPCSISASGSGIVAIAAAKAGAAPRDSPPRSTLSPPPRSRSTRPLNGLKIEIRRADLLGRGRADGTSCSAGDICYERADGRAR